ncbi:MAG: membrane protein insertase YidC [Pseudomonadota bacterium]
MDNQRNLIIAVVLSIVILLGFQFFIEGPRQVSQVEMNEATELAVDESGGTVTGLPPNAQIQPSTDPAVIAQEMLSQSVDRADALTTVPRVTIDTARVHGSLSLVGARLDDLTLADYRETVDPDSPEVTLLSPPNAPSPYYADFGWAPVDTTVPVPGGDTEWTADVDTLTIDQPVTLTWDNGEGLTFERVVEIDENYMFTVTQRVVNQGDEAVALRPFGRVMRFGTPEVLGFFILHEGPYGVFNGTLDEYDYGDLADEGSIVTDSTGGWLGFTDKYWMVALVPDQSTAIDAQFAHSQPGARDQYFATYAADTMAVAPGASVEITNRLFAGAKEVNVIDGYEANLGIENFDLAIDWGWFYFLTRPVFWALDIVHGFVGNFGVAILVFTVFIKLLFFPLANKSYKSMSRMKALQPQMTEIRERYKDDRQKMNQAVMEMYRREKVNPASGCLPILLQIPVFFALYKVLFVTIEMRHAPFFGWIQDLSAVDPTSIWNLFGLIPWTPQDFLPSFMVLGAWPIVMGLTMFLQQKLNPAPTDPMQKRIIAAFPFVFTFLLSTFPAGLVIYWAWNNTLSILQQWVIMKRMGVKIGGGMDQSAAATTAPPSVQRKKKAEEGSAEKSSSSNTTTRRKKKKTGSSTQGTSTAKVATTAAKKKPANADKPTGSGGQRKRSGSANKRSGSRNGRRTSDRRS